jgi:hypothetical protein
MCSQTSGVEKHEFGGHAGSLIGGAVSGGVGARHRTRGGVVVFLGGA